MSLHLPRNRSIRTHPPSHESARVLSASEVQQAAERILSDYDAGRPNGLFAERGAEWFTLADAYAMIGCGGRGNGALQNHVRTGYNLLTFTGRLNKLCCVAMSPDGCRLALGVADNTALVCEALPPAVEARRHDPSWTPDSSICAVTYTESARSWAQLWGRLKHLVINRLQPERLLCCTR